MGSQSPNPNKAPTPVLKVAEPTDSQPDYQIILTFNGHAELVDVAYPENFTPEMANSHLAVATLFMGNELVKKSTEKGGE